MAVRMLCVAALLVGLAGPAEGDAQSKTASKSKSSTTEKDKADSKYRRLPTYFGQLKLKDEQREEVYEVRAQFGPKLEELEKQLEKMRADMMKKMESALTTTQKSELTKLRNGTSTSASSKASSKATSKSKTNTGKTNSAKPGPTKSESTSKKTASGKPASKNASSKSSKSSTSKKADADDQG